MLSAYSLESGGLQGSKQVLGFFILSVMIVIMIMIMIFSMIMPGPDSWGDKSIPR